MTYARAAKLGDEAQQYAVQVKLNAERKLGEMLKETERNVGATDGTPGPGRGGKNVVTPGNHVFSPGRPAPGPSPQIVPIPTAGVPAGPVPPPAPPDIQPAAPAPQPARPSPQSAPSPPSPAPPPPTLDVMGISKRESSEAQLLAEVPPEQFEAAKAGKTSRRAVIEAYDPGG